MADNGFMSTLHINKDSVSLIWFIPLIAFIIAVILTFNAWQSRGPIVEISFDEAAGIEPKRTKIRYKNVEVGTVESVRVSDNLASIVVSAELAPEFSKYLSENTKFWVVSPRVSLSGISGLNTLFSGVYIEIDPGEAGVGQLLFQGLNEPPLIRSDSEGSSFNLFTYELGSLDISSPVYFKQIKVGEITSYRLSENNRDIELTLFIEAPYDKLVTSQSRFWNVSGLEAGLDGSGFNIEFESLNTLISGGVAFDSPDNNNVTLDDTNTSQETRFYILPNRKAVLDGVYVDAFSFKMQFKNQSIRGLELGSPVEYYGIKIGQVNEIRFGEIEATEEKTTQSINVLVDIQPQRLSETLKMDQQAFENKMAALVRNGLRAQLKTASLITGSLFIDLVETKDKSIANTELSYSHNVPLIPTIEGNIDQVTSQLASITTQINDIPIVAIGENLSASLSELNTILSNLNRNQFSTNLSQAVANIDTASEDLKGITRSAVGSLEQLQKTLLTFEESIAPDSQLYYELLETLDGINESADSMRQFTDELNRYPQSLILGK